MRVELPHSLPLGVIIERTRRTDVRFGPVEWKSRAVVPGVRPNGSWIALEQTASGTLYHAATLTLFLHRSDAEAYRDNLAGETPAIYVVLRRYAFTGEVGEVQPYILTAARYEAELYRGDNIVHRVSMPDSIIAWIAEFVGTANHHVRLRVRNG